MAVEKEEVKGGEILFCGATTWGGTDRREGNLVSPTRLQALVGVNIRFVASGCVSCHCVALDVDGRCYTWGRNEKGQLGHGDNIQRYKPTVVSGLSKHKIVTASAGSNHTVVVNEDGLSLAFGWNKYGQLGSDSEKNEIEQSPVNCVVSEVRNIACGADFTVWLTSTKEASIWTAGLPLYGQLGHGTDKESAHPGPRAIAFLAKETIVKVACGTNHTVAVDKNGFVYTWGNGVNGRLGHGEEKDEWAPRLLDSLTGPNVVPANGIVSAGAANSACTAGKGQLYIWGKTKNFGKSWMFPRPLMDFRDRNLHCMDSGNEHHFVGTGSFCFSWGAAQSGELGYGPSGQKRSAVPKTVDILEGMHVISVACGLNHSMVVVDRANVGDQLEKLEVYGGKTAVKGALEDPGKAAGSQITIKKYSENSNKRKAAKGSEESRDEEGKAAAKSKSAPVNVGGKRGRPWIMRSCLS